MRTRTLGTAGLVVSEIGLGCMGMDHAYGPLGNGFLSRKYTGDTKYEEGDFRRFMSRFKSNTIDANQALLALIHGIADGKRARLRENLGASDVRLSEDELRDLDTGLANITIDDTHF